MNNTPRRVLWLLSGAAPGAGTAVSQVLRCQRRRHRRRRRRPLRHAAAALGRFRRQWGLKLSSASSRTSVLLPRRSLNLRASERLLARRRHRRRRCRHRLQRRRRCRRRRRGAASPDLDGPVMDRRPSQSRRLSPSMRRRCQAQAARGELVTSPTPGSETPPWSSSWAEATQVQEKNGRGRRPRDGAAISRQAHLSRPRRRRSKAE